jgi:hypothetical protein
MHRKIKQSGVLSIFGLAIITRRAWDKLQIDVEACLTNSGINTQKIGTLRAATRDRCDEIEKAIREVPRVLECSIEDLDQKQRQQTQITSALLAHMGLYWMDDLDIDPGLVKWKDFVKFREKVDKLTH